MICGTLWQVLVQSWAKLSGSTGLHAGEICTVSAVGKCVSWCVRRIPVNMRPKTYNHVHKHKINASYKWEMKWEMSLKPLTMRLKPAEIKGRLELHCISLTDIADISLILMWYWPRSVVSTQMKKCHKNITYKNNHLLVITSQLSSV